MERRPCRCKQCTRTECNLRASGRTGCVSLPWQKSSNGATCGKKALEQKTVFFRNTSGGEVHRQMPTLLGDPGEHVWCPGTATPHGLLCCRNVALWRALNGATSGSGLVHGQKAEGWDSRTTERRRVVEGEHRHVLS